MFNTRLNQRSLMDEDQPHVVDVLFLPSATDDDIFQVHKHQGQSHKDLVCEACKPLACIFQLKQHLQKFE
jgi:hypothetical protein